MKLPGCARWPRLPATPLPGMLDFYASHRRRAGVEEGACAAPLHDPCVIAYLIDPTLFKGEPAAVTVETASPLTLGQTVCDFAARQPNAQVMTEARAEAALDLIIGHIARL